MTANVQLVALPLGSVAVLVTVVVPTGKVLPLAGVLITFGAPQLSVALTLKVTLLRLHWPASALKSKLAGQVIMGLCVSVPITVTVKVQVLVLPMASVAVLVTVVVPVGKVSPEPGAQSLESLVDWRKLKTPDPGPETETFVTPQLSVAITLKVTLLRLHWPASALTTTLLGQVITGR